MRAITFKLHNGKIVKIRQVSGADYDATVRFSNKFARGGGTKWTWHCPGRPKPDRATTIAMYNNPNELYIAAWDGNEIIGMSHISPLRPGHAHCARDAVINICILDKYTSNGLGNRMAQIIEKWALANKVHKIIASVRDQNIRAIKILIDKGYKIIGLRRDCAFINDEWHNEYLIEKILEKRDK